MRKDQIAEDILALFTTRANAAATVGDLLESDPQPRTAWFWTCLIRTALAMVWRDFSAAPLFIARLALSGLAVSVFLGVGLVFGGSVVLAIAIMIGHAITSTIKPEFPAWLTGAALYIQMAMVGYLSGRWVTRRAKGREVSACLALLLAGETLMPLAGYLLFGVILRDWIAKQPNYSPGIEFTWTSVVVAKFLSWVGIVFAGVRARRARERYLFTGV